MAESDKIPPKKNVRRARVFNPDANLEYGKLPPQAIELEEAVLGGLMLEQDVIMSVIDILQPKSFYKEAHQKIFQSISDLFNRSEPIDILTVTNELKSKGLLEIVGGPFYITQLTNRVASAANSEYHARIIEQKYMAREVIRLCSELITDSYDETHDIFSVTDKLLTEAYNIGTVKDAGSNESNSETVKSIEEKIKRAKELSGITGLRSGLLKQDLAFGGYKPTNFYIKAARPAMGKTGLALCEANYMANIENKKVLFFSIEMSKEQIMERLISINTEISLNKMASGEFTDADWSNFEDKKVKISEENLKIIDIAGLHLNTARKIAKKHAIKNGLDCIFVDYLQLMKDPQESIKGNREQEVSRISVGLKALAKELKVPVIALAQLSRAVETRGGDKRPQLSDLRESGSIEQDADVVQFLYRPEYYGLTEDEEGNSTAGRADLINAKNRHGSIGTIHVKFINYLTKFVDYSTNIESLPNNNNMPINEDFDDDLPY